MIIFVSFSSNINELHIPFSMLGSGHFICFVVLHSFSNQIFCLVQRVLHVVHMKVGLQKTVLLQWILKNKLNKHSLQPRAQNDFTFKLVFHLQYVGLNVEQSATGPFYVFSVEASNHHKEERHGCASGPVRGGTLWRYLFCG